MVTLYVEPDTAASRQAAAWRTSDPEGAARMDRIAAQPQAIWLGEWLPDVERTVDEVLTAAGRERMCAFVLYAIPHRDGSAYSAGGMPDAVAYLSFAARIARGLKHRRAIVVLEPDALCHVDFLSAAELDERLRMMAAAVDILTAAGAVVYIDAGSSGWLSATVVAERLQRAGVARAAGFALNVSHTETTRNETAYAERLRAILGNTARYIIDTSRNGAGPERGADGNTVWCNPRGARLGADPTLVTRIRGCAGFLWIKRVGESDGECGGGPRAGAFWAAYARELAG